MKKYFLPALIFSLLASCLFPKPIDIKLPETEKKLAVSSVVIPGNIMTVSVSYSFSALTNKKDSSGNMVFDSTTYRQFLVEHARVTIRYAGRTDTLFKIVPGVYGSLSTLQIPNESYTLDVYDSTTYLHIIAQSTMLPRVNFDTLYFTKKKTSLDTSVEVHFMIDDDKTKENYYLVSYYNLAASPIYKSLFSNPSSGSFVQNEIYSDKITDALGRIDVTNRLDLPNTNDTLIVQLANISKAYYDYLSAYKRSNQLVFQLLGEPVNIPTNIQGGYGFFGTFNPTLRITDLSKL